MHIFLHHINLVEQILEKSESKVGSYLEHPNDDCKILGVVHVMIFELSGFMNQTYKRVLF